MVHIEYSNYIIRFRDWIWWILC